MYRLLSQNKIFLPKKVTSSKDPQSILLRKLSILPQWKISVLKTIP